MKKIDLTKIKIYYSTRRYVKLNPMGAVYLKDDIVIADFEKDDYVNTGDTILRKDQHVVVVYTELAKHLTEEEMYALLCHEYGHIVLNHCITPSVKPVDMKKENEADDYAIQYVSKELFIPSLFKVAQFIKQTNCNMFGDVLGDIMSKPMLESVATRIDRLLS